MSNDKTEFTPRERGLLAGHTWAKERARTHDDIPEVARTGVVPADVRESVTNAGLPTAEHAFWEGFIHGVRAFVVEVETGSGPN
jgi:hypothetical protein